MAAGAGQLPQQMGPEQNFYLLLRVCEEPHLTPAAESRLHMDMQMFARAKEDLLVRGFYS